MRGNSSGSGSRMRRRPVRGRRRPGSHEAPRGPPGGSAGLCGYYMQPIMDKTHYKLQMVYPIPNTRKEAGQCCQPYGRTTMIWGSGKSFPVSGEDFSYQIFRKRNCCVGAW